MRARTVEQQHTFGRREISDDSATLATGLPIRIEKDVGIGASTFLWGGLILIAQSFWPILFDRAATVDILFHSGGTIFGLALLVLLPVIYLLTRNPGELEITSQGIRVTTAKSGRWFYAWSDIEGAEATSKGTKLLLKGRSDEQNVYNFIPDGFGIESAELDSIITDGVKKFGAKSSGQRTVAPGDDLSSALMRSAKTLLRFYGAMLGAALIALLVWQGWNCMRSLELQKNGRTINATVIRTYTSSCSKRGCSIGVEYAFTPEPAPGRPRTEYRGYQYIAGSRSLNDPDLVYARTYGIVPIIYDVRKPTTSILNFHNQIARDPVAFMFESLAIFGGILAIVAVLFLATLIPIVLQARKAAADSA